MDLCPDCNFVVLCHRFTIFGAWLYHHDVSSTLSASIHLFLQIRVGLDVDIPFGTWVYHQSIGRCFAYLHDLYITLNFDLKVKVMFYNIDSCPGHKFFDLFYRHAIFGTWVYHYETICQVLCFSVRLSV